MNYGQMSTLMTYTSPNTLLDLFLLFIVQDRIYYISLETLGATMRKRIILALLQWHSTLVGGHGSNHMLYKNKLKNWRSKTKIKIVWTCFFNFFFFFFFCKPWKILISKLSVHTVPHSLLSGCFHVHYILKNLCFFY